MVKTATSILAFFKPLTDWIGYDKPEVSSIVLTLTTKVTVLWVLGSSLLAGVNTFFGDPIDCMVEEVPEGIFAFDNNLVIERLLIREIYTIISKNFVICY